MSSKLQLIIRSGCHLCDDMLEGIKEYEQDRDFTLEVIDIMGQPELEQEFGQRIPVLMSENEVICEYFLDSVRLKHYIG